MNKNSKKPIYLVPFLAIVACCISSIPQFLDNYNHYGIMDFICVFVMFFLLIKVAYWLFKQFLNKDVSKNPENIMMGNMDALPEPSEINLQQEQHMKKQDDKHIQKMGKLNKDVSKNPKNIMIGNMVVLPEPSEISLWQEQLMKMQDEKRIQKMENQRLKRKQAREKQRQKEQFQLKLERRNIYLNDSELLCLENKELPVIYNAPIICKPSEFVHYNSNAIYKIRKNKAVGRTGASAGISVRVVKGVYVHSGQSVGKTIYKEVEESYQGQAIFTNQRIVFLHRIKGFECPLKNITAFDIVNNELLLQTKTKSFSLQFSFIKYPAFVLEETLHLINK